MKSRLVPVLILALFLATGAAAKTYYYETISQETADVSALKNAPVFHVAGPAFSGFPWSEYWKDEAKWIKERDEIVAEYAEILPDMAKKKKMQDRIHMLGPGETVDSGVLVTSAMAGYEKVKGVLGGWDHSTFDVTFADAATGKTLFTAKVRVSCKIMGPVGWRTQVIEGRVAVMTWNLNRALLAVMQNGTIAPERK